MKLSPSLLSADFGCLRDQARLVEPFADRFHWDVMDGHFVPNLTFGPPVVNALRRQLRLPFDIHLMIDHPLQYAPQFNVRPDDSIIFHIESPDNPDAVVHAITETSARVGISLRPGTPLDTLAAHLDHVHLVLIMSVEPGFGGQAFLPDAIERIRMLRSMIGSRSIDIAVDGGIHMDNIRQVVSAGADTIIAGSAVFGQPNPADAAVALREAAV